MTADELEREWGWYRATTFGGGMIPFDNVHFDQTLRVTPAEKYARGVDAVVATFIEHLRALERGEKPDGSVQLGPGVLGWRGP